MKLLLTSAGFENPKVGKEFLKLIDSSVLETKVILVPTAARTKEELFYVDKSKRELLNIGVLNQKIETLNLDHKISFEEVNGFDVIYVCGGNTFYLLQKVREAGFDIITKHFLEKGGIYVGASAGSIIVGPDIEIAGFGEKNDTGLKDLTGLHLVDMTIFPHFIDKDRQKVGEFKKKVDYPVLTLTNNQALSIWGNKKRIIG